MLTPRHLSPGQVRHGDIMGVYTLYMYNRDTVFPDLSRTLEAT
jgi:hypothetical protein